MIYVPRTTTAAIVVVDADVNGGDRGGERKNDLSRELHVGGWLIDLSVEDWKTDLSGGVKKYSEGGFYVPFIHDSLTQ